MWRHQLWSCSQNGTVFSLVSPTFPLGKVGLARLACIKATIHQANFRQFMVVGNDCLVYVTNCLQSIVCNLLPEVGSMVNLRQQIA